MELYNEIKRELLDEIEKNKKPYYYSSGNTEIRIRCPYCGDSIKSNRSAHLYIDISNGNIFLFYCQRCSMNGVVTPEFLKDIQIYNFKLSANLQKLNKNVKYNKNFVNIDSSIPINIQHEIKRLNIPYYSSKDKHKLDYINNRFQLNYDGNYWVEKYKTIFNFKDFLLENKINNIYITDKRFLLSIINNYIGFLSNDHSHIIFRNTRDNKNEYRYYNYNIFNNLNGKKFYVPTGQINIMTEKIKLVITEGIFDIISIKEFIYPDNKDIIFVASNGKGYNFIINYFTRMGFLDMDIEIFSDNDVNINFYKHIKKVNVSARNNSMKIYYNKKYKDFGCSKNKIDLKYNYI